MICKETAGILFPKPCETNAHAVCSSCRRPICEKHTRTHDAKSLCVSCVSASLRESGRTSPAWLRDDPYFYWYANTRHFDSFTSSDRALFDSTRTVIDDDPTSWTGS